VLGLWVHQLEVPLVSWLVLRPALQHLALVGAWRMAAIPPTLTFAEMANRFHLHVTHAKLATAARKGVDASWVIKFENMLVFKSHLVFSHETGMKKWLSFQQCWHLPERKSINISASDQLSLPQPLGGASSPPWSWIQDVVGFQKPFGFFSWWAKVAWKNGRHSNNVGISQQERAARSLHLVDLACCNRWKGRWCLLGHEIGDLVRFQKPLVFFLMKPAWKNGRHSNDVGISWQQRVDALDRSEDDGAAWIVNGRTSWPCVSQTTIQMKATTVCC
jgi:hypothetical protein